MNPRHFLNMVRVETQAIFRRGAGIASLSVGLVMGLLALVILQTVTTTVQTNINGAQQVTEALNSLNGVEAAGWALQARNFFILPLFLLLATGGTLAGDLADHNLRELMVRPVSRSAVVLAKYSALLLLSAGTLVLTLVPSLAGGTVIFGGGGPLGSVLLGYAASWLSDAGLIAMGLLIGTFVRGAGAVVVASIALLMVDGGARLFFAAVGAVTQQPSLSDMGHYLPGAALAAWDGWKEGFELAPFLGLGGLLALCLGGTLWRVSRMDIP